MINTVICIIAGTALAVIVAASVWVWWISLAEAFNRGHTAGWQDHASVYNKPKEPLRDSLGRFRRGAK